MFFKIEFFFNGIPNFEISIQIQQTSKNPFPKLQLLLKYPFKKLNFNRIMNTQTSIKYSWKKKIANMKIETL